jgi:hypothetical protein
MSKPLYGSVYNTYPVFSADDGFEPSTKRLSGVPQPRDVFEYALMGLPKVFPLTNEPITPEHVRPFLESAIVEIEMSLGFNITPVQHWQSFDYIDGMFEANFHGLKLERWPATKVVSVQLKFPHTQVTNPYQTYTIPSGWVSLRRNRINVIAAYGAVSVQTDSTNVVSAGGIFSYITGFARGAYQPAVIEVSYAAGFENDRVPTVVSDLIKTWAAWRFLTDILPIMFPYSSVSTGIDSVSQSASIITPQLLSTRAQELEKKKEQLSTALTKVFGRTIKMTTIGS